MKYLIFNEVINLMHLNKKRAKIVKTAIKTWQEEEILDEQIAQKLTDSIHVVTFDWKRAAFWSFFFSLCCFFIALISLFNSNLFYDFLELIEVIFEKDHVRFILSVFLTILFYYIGFYLRKKEPLRIYRNEAFLLAAVVFTAWAISEFGYLISNGSGHFSLLILLACIIYSIIGYFYKSNLVWLFALISFTSWLGAETGYMSGWGSYYLGMNYPLRFTLFGIIMTVVSLNLRNNLKFAPFFSVTLSVSLFYLFVSLWLLSIFGNYSESTWYHVKQIELFHWSILFALAGITALYLGFKLDIRMLRGYGLTFLFINLYTRFFEFFWDEIDKALFFAVLGLSLWFFAKKAEIIWLQTEKQFGKTIDKE